MSTFLAPFIGRLTERKAFKLIGFKALLAWHYLMLFTPLLIGVYEPDTYEFFFYRQLVLYATLALTFFVLIGLDRWLSGRVSKKPSIVILVLTGVAAISSSFFCAPQFFAVDQETHLIATVFLGVSQAFLMHFWLRYYQVITDDHRENTLAVDVVFGSVIAFFVYVLQPPYSYLVASLLPLISTTSLFINWKSMGFPHRSGQEEKANPPHKLDRSSYVTHFMRAVLPTTVFAFVFGMLQGSYIGKGFALMMAIDPLVLLGIVVCGVVLMCVARGSSTYAHIDVLHRVAMLLFTVGIVGLFFGETFLVVSEAVILAGFNLFDFGAMALGISIARQFSLKSPLFINGGRSLTYFALGVGLLVGHLVMAYVQEDMHVLLYSISGLAIVLLMTTTIMVPFKRLRDFDTTLSEGRRQTESVRGEQHLSDDLRGRTMIQEGSARDAACGFGGPGGREDESSIDERKMQMTEGDASKEGAHTPWKRACHQIAALYRLTPRETEIFLLIAKGRNAEYIQRHLFISTHTAKTHIANIYHKLGVHSSQEMLSLVELFRRQEIGGDRVRMEDQASHEPR